jgi:hypothetical protein
VTLAGIALVVFGFVLGHASRVRWRRRRQENAWTLSSVQITQQLARKRKVDP